MSKKTNLPRPLGPRILVSKDAAETVSFGGIIIPGIAQENTNRGVVLALGPEVGKESLKSPRIGDTVQFNEYAAVEIEHEGQEYLLVRENDILIIL